jgi:two-component system NtrC family sensor kinase
MAAIGSVITDLAHNIKNVLLLSEGGIKLMDRLIDEGDLERIQQTWALTQKAVGRISTMVKQMLEYSRTPKIDVQRANLNKIVRETCESFREEFRKEGIAVRLRLDRRIKDSMIDVEGLERALANLLVNACEAISHDNGEITITTVARARDLILGVEDNGDGIPPTQLSRIFFPRFSTKGDEGTGLGLAEVKKWVNTLGGSIHVNSVVDEGSRFVLSLPREAQSTVTVTSE